LRSAAGRAWFQRAVETKTTAVGEYQLSAATGKPALVIAHPLLNDSDAVVRVLSATIALDELTRVAAPAELPPGGTLTLFTHLRTILARYPDAERWIGQTVPDPHVLDHLNAGHHEDVTENVGVDGVARLYVTVPVEASVPTGLFVGMGVAHDTAFAE